MADSNNSGQFGNRSDTQQQAEAGGNASPTKFGSPQGADASAEGKKGTAHQATEDKAEGGRHSHSGGTNS